MDEQEEDEETATRLQEKNKNLENKLEQLNGQLRSFTSQLESVKRKLKKTEFERDSFHSQMESLKEIIKKLSKELHEEKKKNKMTQIRLTESESCRSATDGTNLQSSGTPWVKIKYMSCTSRPELADAMLYFLDRFWLKVRFSEMEYKNSALKTKIKKNWNYFNCAVFRFLA